MKLESKLKNFFNGQLSDEEEQKIMDQVYNYEFKQLLKQELAIHNTHTITSELSDEEFAELPDEEVAATIVSIPTSKPRPSVWYLFRKPLGIAAGVLLLISLVMAHFWFSTPKIEAMVLIQDSLQHLPVRNITAGGNPSEIELRSKANTYYDDGNYQEAALAFQQLIDTGSNTKEDFFYGGLSLLSIKNPTPNYGKAVAYLRKAQNLSQGWKSDDIHFYLAIAYFKNNQFQEAKDLFEQIAKHLGTHQTEAKQILTTFPNQ